MVPLILGKAHIIGSGIAPENSQGAETSHGWLLRRIVWMKTNSLKGLGFRGVSAFWVVIAVLPYISMQLVLSICFPDWNKSTHVFGSIYIIRCLKKGTIKRPRHASHSKVGGGPRGYIEARIIHLWSSFRPWGP